MRRGGSKKSSVTFSPPTMQKDDSSSDKENINDDDRNRLKSLKDSLISQVIHLGGIDNSSWSIIKATFESFYEGIDAPTQRYLYNKYLYWKKFPSRFDKLRSIRVFSPSFVGRTSQQVIASHHSPSAPQVIP